MNEFGLIAEEELLLIPNRFEGIQIDRYAIMPNHVHAIVIFGCEGNAEQSRLFPTLSTVLGLYKSGVSKRIHEKHPNLAIWQKSFHDHIIRNERSYQEISRYIQENPTYWDIDKV